MLLKGYDARGFVFFTNYHSRKGAEALRNPYASLVFPWFADAPAGGGDRARSRRWTGPRPRRTSPPGRADSQLGAWASPQSQVVPDRAALDESFVAAGERFGAGEVPAPPHWGGLRVAPRDGGVLAGPVEPAARPAAVPPRRRRRLGRRAARAVTDDAEPAAAGRRAGPSTCGRCGVPAYRRLWLGNSVSIFGFQFTAVAVPVQMYALTRDSLWVGMLGIAGLVPLLIFGLWGGAIADALRPAPAAAGQLRAGLAGDAAACWSRRCCSVRSPWLLLVLIGAAVGGVRGQFADPARAIMPRLVPTALVPAANTLNFTSIQAATVLGPLTVGVIFAALPHETALAVAYAVDALLFTVSLWAALRLPSMPPVGADEEAPRRAAGLRGVADGLRYLAAAPVLLLSFAVDLIAMVLAMPRALFPEIAEERFGGGAAIGWLYAAIAIGSVLGGLTSGWIGRVRRQGRRR